MKDIFIFLFGVFGGKLIEDNLPNLHYKKLAAGFEKHIAPFLLTAYMGILYLAAKITRNKDVQKNYTEVLAFLTIAFILAKVIEHKKQTEA